jgi:hypothetical protein
MPENGLVEKYVVEEMKAVRERINAEIALVNRYEILYIGLVGVVYAVILQYKISDRITLLIITLLPVLVGVYGFLRYQSHQEIVDQYDSYLIQIETFVKSKDTSFVGLTTFYHASPIRSHIRKLRSFFWISIVLLSVALTLVTQIDPERLARAVTTNHHQGQNSCL